MILNNQAEQPFVKCSMTLHACIPNEYNHVRFDLYLVYPFFYALKSNKRMDAFVHPFSLPLND